MLGPLYLSDHDETDTAHGVVCVRVADIADGLSIAFHATKVLEWLKRIPRP